jgi:hypothetical protein
MPSETFRDLSTSSCRNVKQLGYQISETALLEPDDGHYRSFLVSATGFEYKFHSSA